MVAEVPRDASTSELGKMFDNKMANMAKLQMRMKSLRLKVTPTALHAAQRCNDAVLPPRHQLVSASLMTTALALTH